MVPGADIDIGATMRSTIERYNLKIRDVHDIRPVEERSDIEFCSVIFGPGLKELR
jgi:hypothetical protein